MIIRKTNVSLPYNLVYKNFYARETLIAPMASGIDREKYTETLKVDILLILKPFRRSHTYGYSVKEFKVGMKFVAFLTYSNDLYICLSQEYFEKVHQKP
jgi:hypothetical protein